MNDELITLVRDSFTGVHTATPVEQIVSRGRVVRARRRIPGLAGALAVAAGTALAVTTLLPSTHQASHQAGHQPTAQLAAWMVTKQADGSIRVTIRELRNPAGLQSKLRADGVPASVTLIGQQNPSCRRYPASQELRKRIVSYTFEFLPPSPQGSQANTPQPQHGLVVVMLIRPSALPSGTGVQLASTFSQLSPGAARETVGLGLVYASPQCTG